MVGRRKAEGAAGLGSGVQGGIWGERRTRGWVSALALGSWDPRPALWGKTSGPRALSHARSRPPNLQARALQIRRNPPTRRTPTSTTTTAAGTACKAGVLGRHLLAGEGTRGGGLDVAAP